MTTLIATLLLIGAGDPEPPRLQWKKHVLNDRSPFEAVGVADFNGDGKLDVFCGDSWYEGPTWTRHKVRTLTDVQKNPHYHEDFADMPMDVNGDGRIDIVTGSWFLKRVGWVENPEDPTKPWIEHDIDNLGPLEAARLFDLNGDGQLDLLPGIARHVVWYERVQQKPEPIWKRHDLDKKGAGHGLGAGDVNGDGKVDILTPKGWYEGPAFTYHPDFDLGKPAGLEIIVHDVNEDGRNDLIWGNGHGFGLYWMEQTKKGGWKTHAIDETFSQVHTLLMADIDGDGKKELVTGKRIYAHTAEPGATEAPCIYAFWNKKGTWTRETIYKGTAPTSAPKNGKDRHAMKDFERGSAGVGLDVSAVDVDGDGDVDLVCPGKTGLYLFENLGSPSK